MIENCVLLSGDDVVCYTVTCNEDEGIDIDDHTAASLATSNSVVGVDNDFSDAGRCVVSEAHASNLSGAVRLCRLLSFLVEWWAQFPTRKCVVCLPY